MTPLKTAKLLEEAADDLANLVLPKSARFAMGTYGWHPPTNKAPILKNLCGTSTCAAGWLSLMPKWRRRGFGSYWRRLNTDRTWLLVPDHESYAWERMAAEVFGTKSAEIGRIFLMTTSNRQAVVAAFRRLAKKYREGDSK